MKVNEELKMRVRRLDYQRLNGILKKYVSFFIVKQATKMEQLARILLKFDIDASDSIFQCTNRIDYNEIIERVYSFLLEINPEYGYRFLNILQDGNVLKGRDVEEALPYSVRFERGEWKDRHKTIAYADGRVNIVLDCSIMSIFSTMHECIHKLCMQSNQQSIIFHLLAETPTITLEMVLFDYLMRNYGDEKIQYDIMNFMRWRAADTISKAKYVCAECELIKMYRKKGHFINEEDLLNYLSSCEGETDFVLVHIESIVQTGGVKCHKYMRYVMGFLFACAWHIKIDKNPREVDSIFDLCHILGKSNDTLLEDMEALNEMGFTIFSSFDKNDNRSVKSLIHEEGFVSLSLALLKNLEDCYDRIMAEFFDGKVDNSKKFFITSVKK